MFVYQYVSVALYPTMVCFLACSPHLLSVRERISVGKCGNPVSAILLQQLFQEAKGILDQSIMQEKEALSHFEVFVRHKLEQQFWIISYQFRISVNSII